MNIDRLAFKEGYKYQVYDDFNVMTGICCCAATIPGVIDLRPDGFMVIHSGYAWDGASGPAINTLNFRRGSLVHDALYQLIAEGHLPISYRLHADDLLIAICKEDGMSAVRCWWVKLAVNTFGARALENRNPVLFSPEKP
jgi:hypothetical protein